MTKFYPYVVLKTNVSPKLLKYNIYIYNTVLNQAETAILFKDTAFKKVGNELYQTKSVEIDSSKIGLERLRDCVIILNLYRLTTSGQESLVISRYIVPDKIESYPYPNHEKNKNIPVTKYVESTAVTKVVKGDVSKNDFELSLNRNRIFQCIDLGCKPGEAKDPFSKAQIEAGLQSRLNEPLPDQRYASLCGPAAYFFCLINLSPSRYKLAVKQLWETGQTKIGDLEIRPSQDGCRQVNNFYLPSGNPKIPPIDWITLASLRESENLKLKLKNPSQEVPGITTPMELERWFRESGFHVAASYPIKMGGYDRDFISEINSKYAGPDYYIVTLISASLLDSGISSGTKLVPDHWIVWTDKLRNLNGQPINESSNTFDTKVTLKMFTWGENRTRLKKGLSLYSFDRKIFFALVIKKEKF
ncbi:hypothetical protein [Acinetobacter seifertii]|uniref:hypothetical protein n=1 Tax=Acinetobacter seifertii TaxID=1530123 RepID=UPI00124EFA70|nr:hypothetical protein [Acinetobacter seifertii]